MWSHPIGNPTAWERDKIIDLFNDIVGVIGRFGTSRPGGTPRKGEALAEAQVPPVDETSYHAAFDRGPSAGPNPWNMTAPDGIIDLFNDIVGVISQFGHDCR